MKLWLLEPRRDLSDNCDPWAYGTWDCNDGFVVAAESEEQARRMAADCTVDEGSYFGDRYDPQCPAWLSAEWSRCVELVPQDMKAQIILVDFRAG